MEHAQFLDLLSHQQQTIDAQQRTIDALAERLARLESVDSAESHQKNVNASRPAPAMPSSRINARDGSSDSGLSRRRMLATAATVGSGLLLVRSAQPAAAANGNSLILGQSNDASLTTTLVNTSTGGPTTLLQVSNTSGASLAEGINGRANGAAAAGVVGASDNGYGVYGDSQVGYAVYAGGNGRFGIGQHVASGPPTSGSYGVSDIIRDSQGNIFACVAAGSPGTWKKVIGPQTAGAFHLVNPSFRSIDTRSNGGLLTDSQRTISLAAAGVPLTASAVSVNLTVTETGPAGWAALYSPATGWGGTSTINWNAPLTTIANGAIVAISNQQVSIKVSGFCQFLIDVTGFWT